MSPTVLYAQGLWSLGVDVRYGSLADVSERITDVRFTPKSGHSSVH
jgi:hypothetical protein